MIRTCEGCEERKRIHAKNKCHLCYHKEKNILSSAGFGCHFYGDENSRDSFFNKINEIHRATLLFISTFRILEEENK